MNKKNRRACCLLRVILQGPELLSKRILVEVEMMCVIKPSQWQNLLFKVYAGVDCVFYTRKIFRYKTRQCSSEFYFFFKEEAGKDKSKYYQSVATVINVIECPVFRRCSQNDSSWRIDSFGFLLRDKAFVTDESALCASSPTFLPHA